MKDSDYYVEFFLRHRKCVVYKYDTETDLTILLLLVAKKI